MQPKMGNFVRLHSRKWDLGQRYHAGRWDRVRGDGDAIADIGIGEREPRLLVVLLLPTTPSSPIQAVTKFRT